jgi:uncharacterized protein YbjT (DUF2867 family)
MTSILVTGGTGVLGRVVVAHLRKAGHDVTVTSRREQSDARQVDYQTGAGLDEAISTAEIVVHCVSDQRGRVDRQVIEAAARSGRPHFIYISIVGIDRVPLGYYRTKLAAERLLEDSGLPWTVLRTTQFHDLVRTVLAVAARSPLMPVPNFPVQPIDVTEVAARLAELAVDTPAGRVPDLGGPQVVPLRELAKIYLNETGRGRVMLPIRLPGRMFRELAAGALTVPEHAPPGRSFTEYLRQHPAAARISYRGR